MGHPATPGGPRASTRSEYRIVAIPDWNSQAVIPPVRDVPVSEQHLPENRSPYRTTLIEVVERFATTPQRVQLLHGLLTYRQALYVLGIRRGYQWLDGSFVERVETRIRPGKEPRPYDIDVVTFFYPPAGDPTEYGELFDPDLTRPRYFVDAYAVTLGVMLDDHLVNTIGYWYGMWSLREHDKQPKGFIQIDLDPEHDHEAREALNAKTP